jgi:hypothetical protein
VYVFRGASRAVGALLVGFLAGFVLPLPLAVGIGVILAALAFLGPAVFPKVRRLAF